MMRVSMMDDFGNEHSLVSGLSIDAMQAFLRFDIDGTWEAICDTNRYPQGTIDEATLAFFGLI